MASVLQAPTQGKVGRSEEGLQGLHSYFNFFFFSPETKATGSSRMGSLGSSSTTSKTSTGQALTQSPQPSHLSVSRVMKKSPEASL